jgi:predicted molibdopterin-dependent oxidoreductase YjgC
MPEILHIKIDDKTADVSRGTTVLEAARVLGIHIPTLCHLPGREPYASCMLCVVLNCKSGQLFPSCSYEVTDGMEIDTRGELVLNARKRALELLLSDHVGECEAPCQIACPSGINIPKVFTALQQNQWQRAYEVIMESCDEESLPCLECEGVCARVCRRRKFDEPLNIRGLMLEVYNKCQGNFHLLEKRNKQIPLKYKHRLGRLASEYTKHLFANCGSLSGLSAEKVSALNKKQDDPIAEAARCLLCGCAESDDCKLRLYADLYGANSKTFEGAKSETKPLVCRSNGVLHEQGKCIKCGVCVRLSNADASGVKMGFNQRGFDMRVEAISNSEKTVDKMPASYVENCPTGALSWQDRSKT